VRSPHSPQCDGHLETKSVPTAGQTWSERQPRLPQQHTRQRLHPFKQKCAIMRPSPKGFTCVSSISTKDSPFPSRSCKTTTASTCRLDVKTSAGKWVTSACSDNGVTFGTGTGVDIIEFRIYFDLGERSTLPQQAAPQEAHAENWGQIHQRNEGQTQPHNATAGISHNTHSRDTSYTSLHGTCAVGGTRGGQNRGNF
jgi:hypothetical protein